MMMKNQSFKRRPPLDIRIPLSLPYRPDLRYPYPLHYFDLKQVVALYCWKPTETASSGP